VKSYDKDSMPCANFQRVGDGASPVRCTLCRISLLSCGLNFQ